MDQSTQYSSHLVRRTADVGHRPFKLPDFVFRLPKVSFSSNVTPRYLTARHDTTFAFPILNSILRRYLLPCRMTASVFS